MSRVRTWQHINGDSWALAGVRHRSDLRQWQAMICTLAQWSEASRSRVAHASGNTQRKLELNPSPTETVTLRPPSSYIKIVNGDPDGVGYSSCVTGNQPDSNTAREHDERLNHSQVRDGKQQAI